MARIYGILKRLPLYGVGETQAKEIIGTGDLVQVIERMERALAPDVMAQLLDSQGCIGSVAYRRECARVGKELAGLSLREKLRRINAMSPDSESIVLEDGKTLSVTMRFGDTDRCKCVCSASVKKGARVSDLAEGTNPAGNRRMPLSYCYCCAGGFRRHLQLKLGVSLHTEGIVSSPISSGGEKPCAFVFSVRE